VNISVVRGNSWNPGFRHLVSLLDADLAQRYGELQSGYDQYNSIEALNAVVVAYVDQEPAACGAFKLYDVTAVEIKRMFVRPEQRRKGLAARVLEELELWAREAGHTRAVLETGIRQLEAIQLYRKCGYGQTGNYGQYRDNDNSVCFSKQLKWGRSAAFTKTGATFLRR
jgi:putative acetyltransferase